MRPPSRIVKSRNRRASYHSQAKSWYEIRNEVNKRAKGKCEDCGEKGNEVHHIIPLSRGGTNSPSNLILLCKDCHDRRHNHLKRRRR